MYISQLRKAAPDIWPCTSARDFKVKLIRTRRCWHHASTQDIGIRILVPSPLIMNSIHPFVPALPFFFLLLPLGNIMLSPVFLELLQRGKPIWLFGLPPKSILGPWCWWCLLQTSPWFPVLQLNGPNEAPSLHVKLPKIKDIKLVPSLSFNKTKT